MRNFEFRNSTFTILIVTSAIDYVLNSTTPQSGLFQIAIWSFGTNFKT